MTKRSGSGSQYSDEPELPRVEPEIIPPDRSARGNFWRQDHFRGTYYVHTARIGPLGFALLMIAIGAIAVISLITLIGAVLIWVPVIILVAAMAGLFRFFVRR